jgi:hypothetical protein
MARMLRTPQLVVVCALAVVAACGGGSSSGSRGDRSPAEEATERPAEKPTATTTTTTAPPPPPELPRGGREIFPAFRVVAHYGNASSAAMGILGETPPEQAAARVEAAAAPFAQPERPVLPAFELIATVAQAAPGPDGDYSSPTDLAVVRRWLEAARAARMLLVLDVQPGLTPFPQEVRRYEELLREPDVGLALDPEWRMPPGQVPGQKIGTVDAAEVNEVSAWLAAIVQEEDLPEKLFILHQFTFGMITNRAAVVDRPGLATVFHIDGFGGRGIKLQKYQALKTDPPFANGLKLFHDEDTHMFTPPDVLAMVPAPDLITYQ